MNFAAPRLGAGQSLPQELWTFFARAPGTVLPQGFGTAFASGVRDSLYAGSFVDTRETDSRLN